MTTNVDLTVGLLQCISECTVTRQSRVYMVKVIRTECLEYVITDNLAD